MKFENKSLKFLEKYLNTASPTGFEQNGQKLWAERSEERRVGKEC